MGKTAFVFPGQASQVVGMGYDVFVNYKSARGVFEFTNSDFEENFNSIIFNGSQEQLNQTAIAQPAIATVSLAIWQALEEASGFMQIPSMVAGHSLGEYSSLAVSGCLSIKDTLKLATLRGNLMQSACDDYPGGMVAIIGIELGIVDEVCRSTGAQISNINSPSQIIVSGSKEDLARAIDLARARGARKVVRLPVSGAFHSSLMQPIQDKFNSFIDELNFEKPYVPIIGNTTAMPITSVKDIKEELKVQLASCVKWSDSVSYMAQNGVTKFVEIGPGKVISGLIKRIVPDATVVNIATVDDINSYINSI